MHWFYWKCMELQWNKTWHSIYAKTIFVVLNWKQTTWKCCNCRDNTTPFLACLWQLRLIKSLNVSFTNKARQNFMNIHTLCCITSYHHSKNTTAKTNDENQTKQYDEYGYYSFHIRHNNIFFFCVISGLMLHGIEIPLFINTS